MAIPVYLWLKDDGGADIKGSVDVQDREGSIEVVAQEHNLYIPTDNNTGKLTGTRIHTPFLFTKEIDSSSPYLYKAVTTGQTLKSAEFKWYRINDAGQEVEYFNTKLENVKVVKVNPLMHDIKNPAYRSIPRTETRDRLVRPGGYRLRPCWSCLAAGSALYLPRQKGKAPWPPPGSCWLWCWQVPAG